MRVRAEPLTGPVARHGEGPVWWPGWGGLRWVDLLAGDVLTLRADATVARRHVADVVAALRPREAGGAVLALARGFALEGPDGAVAPLPQLWDDPTVRMNDGACDPNGRFWCGSMADDARPGAGALWRLDADGGATRVFEGLTISNGLGWSPEGTRAYHVDSPTQRVDVLAYDSARGLHDRRPFVRIPREAGLPDGLAVDADGGVWVALFGGGAVHGYSAEGELRAVVEVPTPHVTACAFGGPRLDELYVTTSRAWLAAPDPLAGALFRARVDAQGQPTRPFAG